ncbi:MAG: cyclic nucleotide-binding/CBS domain-containing protein [Rhodobacteraceae bacterium]|nr:cyclic nucleotide-binding/CBS domain-containing protein [Paracoccaceae bacterium]
MPDIATLLSETPPYDTLPEDDRAQLVNSVGLHSAVAAEVIFSPGMPQCALYLIAAGRVDITDASGALLSILGPGNSFGERGLMQGGTASTTATASEDSTLITIPAGVFHNLVKDHPGVLKFFDHTHPASARRQNLTTMTLRDLMTPAPLACPPDTPLVEAARAMRNIHVSCIIVADGKTVHGILTTGDIASRAVAEGLPPDTPIRRIMTTDPVTLPPTALVADVLHTMVEQGITHMPVVQAGALVGILTQTDLMRFQATSSAGLIRDIATAPDSAAIAGIVGKIPDLLVQLVAAQNPHHVVTRLITDICDATTRRLLALAEKTLGPPPVPYLWLACGSQGRQEQTGVSDQDNCLILSDDTTAEHDAYFAGLAKFVSDGLDKAGYFHCPGDMMATNPQWRQPLKVWRDYFRGWITTPGPRAQMLASVMFDLRPIGGNGGLFEDLQAETLNAAASNSIFVAHMTSNSLKHQPPLGLFRGFATVRGGEHKNTIDMKHNGVVPVVDLGRIYALKGQLTPVNTRARLLAAMDAGTVSSSGGRDLRDAYDIIAQARLDHQARQIKSGTPPDNFMPPADLSDFERNHLRDAFVVIKTMQSAAGSSGGGYLN